MRQRAIVVDNWISDAEGNKPSLSDLLQAGESVTDRTSAPSEQIPAATNCTLVEVWAEEARITALDGLAAYTVIWREYYPTDDTPPGTTAQEPGDNMTDAEITALRNYLEAWFGWTPTQIANWFGVAPAQLASWLRNNTRQEAAQKLKAAFRTLKRG